MRGVGFHLDERLNNTKERPLAANVPIPLSERLDQLVGILDEAGKGRISRKELVSALLLAAPP